MISHEILCQLALVDMFDIVDILIGKEETEREGSLSPFVSSTAKMHIIVHIERTRSS
jgi:hypothetical protein